eukprot:4851062-Prymnesium_polylepis.2
MVHGAEDGFNHPQPTGSYRPRKGGRVDCFWNVWGVWGMCRKRNAKSSNGDPPRAAPNPIYACTRAPRTNFGD